MRFLDKLTVTWWLRVIWCAVALAGCGTMKSRTATEQLLVSDAIERSVAEFDFMPLNGMKVFLDTQYMARVSAQVFLNSDYIRSCLRENLMMAGCILQENRDDADVIIEVRVGALGTDGHEVNYGIPASQPINAAAAVVSGTPLMPVLPEVSLAKRDETRAAAKIRLFAYDRKTLHAVWAPGGTHGESTAKSTWVLGAGPFEQGSIFDRTQFAGAPLVVPELQQLGADGKIVNRIQRSLRTNDSPRFNVPNAPKPFAGPQPPAATVVVPDQDGPGSKSSIQQASASEPITEDKNPAKPDPEKTEANKPDQGTDKEAIAPVVIPSAVQTDGAQDAPVSAAPLPQENAKAN